jgi:SAM-dependent methyltransferase
MSSSSDKVFGGSVPKIYDTYLVPLIFIPYAADIVKRLAERAPARVLEVAAGTGVVTREMARALPTGTEIVATDLNQPMLDQAAAVGSARQVEWRQADALQLPFEDQSFDAVVCQFGVMFFPDRARAMAEARRVLRKGGAYLFNVWDRLEENEFANAVTKGLASRFPSDPPRFLARTPYGYHDVAAVTRDVVNGGFEKPPAVATVAARSRAESPRVPAIAFCQGTPLRGEIEARDSSSLGEATEVAAEAIAVHFGRGPVDAKIQAHVVVAEK